MTSKEIIIREATPDLLPSLTTLVPRAFHPTNEFHRKVFPDTSANRAWWTQAFSDEIASPACHVLVAAAPETSEKEAIALLCLRLLAPSEPTQGFWHFYPLSPDHDASLFVPAMETMKLLPGQGTQRFLLELFGVDHAYKGSGIGRKLLEYALGIADQRKAPVYVEANHLALKFYEKFGFVESGAEKVKMEGMEYYLHLLVRWPVNAKGE